MEAIIITALIKELVGKFVSELVVPKLKEFEKSMNLDYQTHLVPITEHFSEYLTRTYEHFSIINTLACNNNQMRLKEIYVPLTFKISKNDFEESFKIDGYPISLMENYKKVLIVDSAGMGKSTASKRMYLDIIEKRYGIPIFIELRRLTKDYSILDEVKSQLNSLSKIFNHELTLEFLKTGNFIFFLDGYDEISLKERKEVTNDIQDFICKAGNNKFIMTSRPETVLACFGDFQKISIEPLTRDEAYELLYKYDNNGEVSKALVEKLKTDVYSMIDDFLENPLLVSLLFVAFDHKQTIPLKKHIFYRQVFEAQFESHDLSKGGGFIHEKKSGLDIDDFDRVLRNIGFHSFCLEKLEFSKDDLLLTIAKARTDCVGLVFKESDFFDDILNAVPLFHQDGNYYKWAHRSLQEYFAAEFIYKDSKGMQDRILTSIYHSGNFENFYNLLDLYYDIDIQGFRKNILKPFLLEYQKQLGIYEDDNELMIQRGLLFNRKVYVILNDHEFDIEQITETISKVDPTFDVNRGLSRESPDSTCFLHFVEQYTGRYIIRILLMLLYNKQSSLVSAYEINNDIQKLFFVKKLVPYPVIPSKHSYLNSAGFTEEVNSVLSVSFRFADNLYITYDKCIQELQKIDLEIQREIQSFDFLF